MSSVEASAVSGSSSIGTPPHGWRGGKPPRSRRGGKPHPQLETLQEPSASSGSSPSEPPKQVSDGAGSDDMRPLNRMFTPGDVPDAASAPPQAPSTGAAALPSPVSAQAASVANPDKPPPELAHVLSLLSRLLSASAVLVDLTDPPATYIRYVCSM